MKRRGVQRQKNGFAWSLIYLGFVLNFNAFAQSGLKPDSITVSLAVGYNEVSKVHRFWFGDNYRTLWSVPVKMKVFRLKEEKGGMTILKVGGGKQTK